MSGIFFMLANSVIPQYIVHKLRILKHSQREMACASDIRSSNLKVFTKAKT